MVELKSITDDIYLTNHFSYFAKITIILQVIAALQTFYQVNRLLQQMDIIRIPLSIAAGKGSIKEKAGFVFTGNSEICLSSIQSER
jgi:hypothetical protein